MSINLRIEPYCENCPEFVPTLVEKTCLNDCFGLTVSHNTIVGCTHADRCRGIKEYLTKEKDVNDQT